MSKFDDEIAKYKIALEECGVAVDDALLHKITRGIGPAIYNRDSRTVAFSSKSELQRVANGFIKKRLELDDSTDMLQLLDNVKAVYSKSPRLRAVVYYLLVVQNNKQALFV